MMFTPTIKTYNRPTIWGTRKQTCHMSQVTMPIAGPGITSWMLSTFPGSCNSLGSVMLCQMCICSSLLLFLLVRVLEHMGLSLLGRQGGPRSALGPRLGVGHGLGHVPAQQYQGMALEAVHQGAAVPAHDDQQAAAIGCKGLAAFRLGWVFEVVFQPLTAERQIEAAILMSGHLSAQLVCKVAQEPGEARVGGSLGGLRC